MKMAKEQEHPAKVKSEKGKKSRKGLAAGLGGDQFTEREEALFEKLRTLRAEIAKEEKVPPYIVFSDKTLTHMCVVKPVTKEEMLKVTGVGEFKYTKYGERFLACVKKETQTEAGGSDWFRGWGSDWSRGWCSGRDSGSGSRLQRIRRQ